MFPRLKITLLNTADPSISFKSERLTLTLEDGRWLETLIRWEKSTQSNTLDWFYYMIGTYI